MQNEASYPGRDVLFIAVAVAMLALASLPFYEFFAESSTPASQPPVTVAPKMISKGGSANPQSSEWAEPAVTRWGNDPRAESVAAMREGYIKAIDLRAFFDQALRRPEHGGIYYAKRALFDCVVVKGARLSMHEKLSPDAESRSKRIGVPLLEGEVQRCGSLADHESKIQLNAALNSPAVRLDPEMSLIQIDRDARTDHEATLEMAAQLLDRAVALGDAYFLTDAMRRVIDQARTFEGEEIDEPRRRLLDSLALVMQCDLGGDCEHDVSTIVLCFQNGDCGRSTTVRILQNPEYPAALRQSLFELSAEMTNAAREGALIRMFGA